MVGYCPDRGIYDENAKLPTLQDFKDTAQTTAGITLLLNALTGGSGSNQNLSEKKQNSENLQKMLP